MASLQLFDYLSSRVISCVRRRRIIERLWGATEILILTSYTRLLELEVTHIGLRVVVDMT